MKKDQKYLNDLEKRLGKISKKNKEKIIAKYRKIIDEKKSEGKKIVDILKEIGTTNKVAENELLELNSKKKFLNLKSINIFKRKKESKDNNEKNNDKIAKKIFKKKDKKASENIFKKIFKKKTKKEKIIDSIEETKEEIIEEAASIIPEKKIFESKKSRIKRITYKSLGLIFLIILLFIWLWSTTVFIASLFALLDGVKFYGLNILLLGISLIGLWLVILFRNIIFKHEYNKKNNFISLLVIIVIIALGLAMTIYKISNIKTVKDVSEKYSMTKYYKIYDLPKEENKKYNLTFNSNYKTNYVIEYDNKLNNQVKVEVKYYDCYYDFYVKQSSNYNLYISLKSDSRDRLSVYINDFKDNKVYDSDELERYTVKITINEKDKDKLNIY